VRACVRSCVRACVRACVYVHISLYASNIMICDFARLYIVSHGCIRRTRYQRYCVILFLDWCKSSCRFLCKFFITIKKIDTIQIKVFSMTFFHRFTICPLPQLQSPECSLSLTSKSPFLNLHTF